MQRRTKLLLALGAAGIIGFMAVAESALADRTRGKNGYHGGGHHQGMMARQFRSMAERYDLDQDGEITQEEIDRNRAEWHAEFSGDGDAMTLGQFQDLWLRARRHQMVREFQSFDRDGDGRITLEEYQRPMDDLVQRFARSDSQSLSREDFQRSGKKHRRGMKQRRGNSERSGTGSEPQNGSDGETQTQQ